MDRIVKSPRMEWLDCRGTLRECRHSVFALEAFSHLSYTKAGVKEPQTHLLLTPATAKIHYTTKAAAPLESDFQEKTTHKFP